MGTRLTVLGSIGIERDGVLLPLGGPQQRRLLAVLLTDPGRVVSVERISSALWNDTERPDSDWRTVRTYASRLRTVIGERLITREPGYLLDLDGAELDRFRFSDLVSAASGQAPSLALAMLDEALELWRGVPYAEFYGEWWARPDVVGLEELRLRALEQRFAALAALGRDAEIVVELGRATTEHPLREQFAAQLMTALYRTGREAEAHRAYQRYRSTLVETAGLDPSPRLVDLDRSISSGVVRGTEPRRARAYELHEQLGQGRFGTVYRAVQSDLGREVAVKALRRDVADEPGFVRRFESEAQLVARLEHPHIVPLYDYWREPGGAFLVFRLLQGSAHQRVAMRGPLGLDEVDRTLQEVGTALAVAHRAGIIHRDVKPANILYDDDGNAYLGDFGLAVLADSETATARQKDRRYPRPYSPEVAAGGVASALTDQFGLAVTAWELLTGTSPTASPATPDGGWTVSSLPSIGTYRGDVPAAVDEVLRRAGHEQPDERYPSIAEFLDEWSGALGHRGKAQPAIEPVNPYKGLRAFTEADHADFFGRRELCATVTEAVLDKAFVAVIGPSGCGKTSVLNAGVVPRLRSDPRTLVVSMTPGPHPIRAIGAALGTVAPLGVALDPSGLADDAALSDAVDAILGVDADRLVVVIDQLEQLWSLTAADERASFVRVLAGALDRQAGRLRAVSAIRADWLDRPLQDPVLGQLVGAGACHVTVMSAAELHEAIVAPASAAGLIVEPTLVTQLIADLGAGTPSLPLLQFALTELAAESLAAGGSSQAVTLAAYQRLGGIAGALSGRADAVLATLDDEQLNAVRKMFGRLAVIGDGAPDTRRQLRRADLDAVADEVIEHLGTARILTLDHDVVTHESTVELAHDALLQHWPTLRRWLDEDRADLLAGQRIAESADAWRRSGQDPGELLRGGRLQQAIEVAERGSLSPATVEFVEASSTAFDEEERAAASSRRRLRRLVAMVGAALVVAVLAGGLAWVQRGRARQSASHAVRSAAEAETARLAATAASLAGSNAPVADLLAVEAARRAGVDANLASTTLQRVLTAKPRYLGALPTVGEYAFSTDGQLLVARTSAGVEAYDMSTRQLTASSSHPMGAGIAGRRLAVTDTGIVLETSGDADVRRWQLPSLTELAAVHTGADVTALEATPDGTLFTGHADGSVEVWNAGSGERRSSFEVDGRVSRLSASTDGALVVVGTIATIDVVRVETSERLGDALGANPLDVAMSPDGKTVVVTTQFFETLSFDTTSGAQIAILPGGVIFARFVDDANVALSQGFQVSVVDARSGTPGRTVATTCGCDFAVSRDGHTLASGLAAPGLYTLGDDGPLGPSIDAPPETPVGGLVAIARSGDGLLSIGWTFGGIEVLTPDSIGWQIVHQEPAEFYGGLLADGLLLRFSFDHGSLVDPRTGEVKADFAGVGPSASFAGTADGRWVAYGLPDGSVAVIDTTDNRPPRVLADLQSVNQNNAFPFAAVVGGVQFSPDGEWLAASSWSGASAVWHVGDWSQFRVLTPGVVDVNGAAKPAFDTSGKHLALSYGRRSIRVFDTSSWKQVGEIAFGTQGLPLELIFSPSGAKLTVVFDTAQAVTYDTESGSAIGAPLPAAPLATPLYLDETTMALARPDSPAVVLWHLDTAALVAEACRQAGRNLTRDEWTALGPRDLAYHITCAQFPEPQADPTRSRDITPARP